MEDTLTPALSLEGRGEKRGVIITGGAKRVGAHMAVYFARAGYDVALHYHTSEKEAKAVQADLRAAGASCELFKADLADISGIPALIKTIHAAMPQCNVLVNNASVFERKEFMETDEVFFDQQFAVNLKAPFFLTQAFAKTFQKGSVINMVDTNITTNHPSHFAYLLSKKSFADFTKMAAVALGPNIRVNGICPGHMLSSSDQDAAYGERLKITLPLKNHPSLDELSESVRWLAEQKHITGQLIFIDGGKHVN